MKLLDVHMSFYYSLAALILRTNFMNSDLYLLLI